MILQTQNSHLSTKQLRHADPSDVGTKLLHSSAPAMARLNVGPTTTTTNTVSKSHDPSSSAMKLMPQPRAPRHLPLRLPADSSSSPDSPPKNFTNLYSLSPLMSVNNMAVGVAKEVETVTKKTSAASHDYKGFVAGVFSGIAKLSGTYDSNLKLNLKLNLKFSLPP
ncbi:hypothetical protein G7046_g9704 [Stylonectria norvegica]|nr:hypothetical protein G7046_g9704 [Stylonectria norvegica]